MSICSGVKPKVTSRSAVSTTSAPIPGEKSPLEAVLAQMPGGAISQLDMSKLKEQFSDQVPEQQKTVKTFSQSVEFPGGVKADAHSSGLSSAIQQN